VNCENKVAIVTGAADGGMGRSIALTLAREGARVVVNYRTSQAAAEAIVDHITSQGGTAIAVQADVFDAAGCKALVEATVAQFERVDILIVGPGGGWHPEGIDRLAPDGAQQDLTQETAPLYHLMPLVLPGMYERAWGRLIGIATHPDKRSPAYAYNVGKAARTHALLLAHEQAWPHGVTVNVVAPGLVAAILRLEDAVEHCDHGPAWQERADISPQDVAEGVALLCSESGRFISGCALPYLFSG